MIPLAISAAVALRIPVWKRRNKHRRTGARNTLGVVGKPRKMSETMVVQYATDIEIKAIADDREGNVPIRAKVDKRREVRVDGELINEALNLFLRERWESRTLQRKALARVDLAVEIALDNSFRPFAGKVPKEAVADIVGGDSAIKIAKDTQHR
jgi:hypothetical protein